MSSRRPEAETIEHRPHVRGGMAMEPGELDLLVSNLGELAEGALEVAGEGIADGVELDAERGLGGVASRGARAGRVER